MFCLLFTDGTLLIFGNGSNHLKLANSVTLFFSALLHDTATRDSVSSYNCHVISDAIFLCSLLNK